MKQLKSFFFLFILISSLACSADTIGFGENVEAYFLKKDGTKTSTLDLAVARTEKQRAKGLMYVKKMPKNKGMLFIFPEEKKLSFWMRNTFISLDMIFLDKQKKVKGILNKVPILNDKPRSIEGKSKYVVELNAGVAKSLGIKKGDTLVF